MLVCNFPQLTTPSLREGELLRSNFVFNATSKPDRSSSSPPGKGEWPQAEGVK